MALGDVVQPSAITSTLQVGATFTCPNCSTVNTTPQVQVPGKAGGQINFYANYSCVQCVKPFLVKVTQVAMLIAFEQVG